MESKGCFCFWRDSFTYNEAPLKSHELKKLATSPAQRTSHGNLALIFCMRKKEGEEGANHDIDYATPLLGLNVREARAGGLSEKSTGIAKSMT